jgi:hypothetical protein
MKQQYEIVAASITLLIEDRDLKQQKQIIKPGQIETLKYKIENFRLILVYELYTCRNPA